MRVGLIWWGMGMIVVLGVSEVLGTFCYGGGGMVDVEVVMLALRGAGGYRFLCFTALIAIAIPLF